MPSAVQVDRPDGDVAADGLVQLREEAKRLTSQAKQNSLAAGEIVQLGLPDKKNGDSMDEKSAKSKLGKLIENYPPQKPYEVAIREVPVTVERLPYIPKKGDRLIDPGTARVNIAASKESPNGTTEGDWAKNHEHQTVVQQHVEYFDPDRDGIIWPQDTYNGFRAWGWAFPICLFGMIVIHSALSYPTSPSWFPDPFFRLYVANMHKDKHGSDSMTYDNEGRFRPQSFEDLFAKYDQGNKGGLDARDLARAHKGQRLAMDFFGWSASFLEWLAVYLLLWPEDGIIRKEDVRRVFDGSIFQVKADEYAAQKNKKQLNKHKKSA